MPLPPGDVSYEEKFCISLIYFVSLFSAVSEEEHSP